MTRVSKYPLSKEMTELINAEFIQFISHTSAIGALDHFLTDFLTPTELVMLSKRLMIAVLLRRDYAAESIKSRLNVSNSAIMGVQGWLKFPRSGTEQTFNDHNKQKNFVAFLDKIEALLDKLPPGKYRNWQIVGKEKFARFKSRQTKDLLR